MSCTNDLSRWNEFIDSIDSKKSASVAKSFSVLGESNYSNCNLGLVKKAILSTNPKDIKSITTSCNILKRYAEYICDSHLLKLIDSIDRNELWKLKKHRETRKYIAHSSYKSICREIESEQHNDLYYKTLFMAVYEGIYSKDYSVLKNLKSRDIENNRVTLNTDDGDCYYLEVSNELANNLRELSSVKTWEQTARFGIIQLPMEGKYEDTCFKTVQRGRGNKNEAAFYRLRLRKIAKEYLDYPITPYELFVSGIAYRITSEIKANGLSLQKAFLYNNKDRLVGRIISSELEKCRYSNKVSNFREMIVNSIDLFEE